MKKRNFLLPLLALTYVTAASSAMAYSANVTQAIHAALDDEYKAHTTYAAYLKHFGEVRPFSNIIQSEARHIEALKDLLKKAGAAIPENLYKISEIDIPTSITEACKIGIKAEEENVALYHDNLLPTVQEYAEVVTVFTNLANASQQRHLEAFKRCASRGS